VRDFALASLGDGGEEVEGSIGYDIWDLGSMNYAGDVQVERVLLFGGKVWMVGRSMVKKRATSDVVCEFLRDESMARVFVGALGA
jgi:hypothetical protein